MTNKAYKFRVYPTEVQEHLIVRTFGCVRLVWNLMLQALKDSYAKDKKFLSPTPAKYKSEFPFLTEVDSLALCNAQLNLQISLSRYLQDKKTKKTRKAGFPKWKTKKDSRRSFTTNWVNGNIRIEDGKLRLPKLGLVGTVFHRHVIGNVKSVTVSQDPTGKFFASILTEQPDQIKPKIDINNVVGLDFSFHDLIVTSDGARLKYPRWFRSSARKLARAQRSLSRRTLDSKGYEKQKLRVAVIHEYIRNRRLDFLRKLAKRILDRYDVVVVEDIDLQGLAKRGVRRKFGKTIMDLGFGILRELLKQGAESRGKLYVVADRWFPSSQLCSACGYRNHETKDLSIRTWVCYGCGVEHDRDVNAAKNLVHWYREHRDLNTGALPVIHAEGESASTVNRKVNGKQFRGTRKNCRAVDPTSPSL